MTHLPMDSSARATRLRVAAMLAALTLALPAGAAVNGYHSSAAFNTALSGLAATTYSFETVAAGTSYAAGTGPADAGFTLAASADGLLPMVADTFWTTSGTHYLGLNNPDTQFQTGDSVSFSFAAPVRAFGLFVVVGSDAVAGDVALSAGSGSVQIGTAETSDGNGSFAFYVGLVADSADSAFSSATVTGVSPDYRLFAVDDVTVAAIPEPATWAMTLGGLAVLGLAMRRRRARPALHSAQGVNA